MFYSLLIAVWALVPLVEQPASFGRADTLISRLGSKDFAEREASMRALEAMGSANLDRLKQALKNPDPEVRYRAEILIQAIERRERSARLLAPRMVRLEFHDTTFESALRSVREKTGLQLNKDADVGSTAVDLDTGELPLWEALDVFCQKTGLVDVTQDRLRRMQVARDAAEQAVNFARVFPGQVQPPGIRQAYAPRTAEGFSRLILTARPDNPIATSYAGAVRMRLLEPARRAADEIRLVVDVSVEPGVSWRQIVDVRVDKAIDNRDGKLVQPLAGDASGVEAEAVARVLMNDMAAMGRYTGGDEACVMIRLKEEHAADKLKELTGTLVAQVLAPVQEFVHVNDLPKQAGKTFRSGRGESVEISSVELQTDNRIRLRLVFREPNSTFQLSRNGRLIALNGQAGNRVIVQGNLVIAGGGRSGLPSQSLDVRFFDKDDQQIHAENFSESIRIVDGEISREFDLLFSPSKGNLPLEHLAWHGRRIETVDIPFRFADIPLPPRPNRPARPAGPIPARYPPGDFGSVPFAK